MVLKNITHNNMDLNKIFVIESRKGILLINSENAEMLAVDKKDVNNVVESMKNENNESIEIFCKPLLSKDIIETEICSCKSIAIIPTFKCNFACEYCFEKDYEKKEMTLEMVHYIKMFIEQWNLEMNCSASYDEIGLMGGEVFREENRPLMETIFTEFGYKQYKVTTNGANILLFEDIIKKYRPLVAVSLDGTEQMQLSRRKTGIEDVYKK